MPQDTSSPATQRITYGDSRMKRLRYHLSAAAAAIVLALLALSPPVFAGGMWEQLPEAGVAVCNNTVNGVCVSTTAAAPSPSGLETLPGDTNLSGGRNPQSARYSFQQLGIGGVQYAVPLTGTTVTVATAPVPTSVILEPAGTLATLTVALPAAVNLLDGQTFRLCSTQTLTALTVTAGTGSTLAQTTPTAITISATAPQCYEWQYLTATTKWYRLQ